VLMKKNIEKKLKTPLDKQWSLWYIMQPLLFLRLNLKNWKKRYWLKNFKKVWKTTWKEFESVLYYETDNRRWGSWNGEADKLEKKFEKNIKRSLTNLKSCDILRNGQSRQWLAADWKLNSAMWTLKFTWDLKHWEI
jgi:hypothetical protein